MTVGQFVRQQRKAGIPAPATFADRWPNLSPVLAFPFCVEAADADERDAREHWDSIYEQQREMRFADL